MGFFASNNRILLTDNNQVEVFDTNNKMPVIITALTGYLDLPSRVADAQTYSQAVYDIGPAAGSFDFIIGSASYTSQYIVDTNTVLTRGAMIGDFSGSIIPQIGTSASQPAIYGMRVLSPLISGGRAYIVEDYRVDGATRSWLLAFTLQYKFHLGRYV